MLDKKMEKTLKEVRQELHEWVTDREKTIRGIRGLARKLENAYASYKSTKTMGLSIGVAAGVLSFGAFVAVITGGGVVPLLCAVPVVFLGAGGGAATAVASIMWTSALKRNLSDAKSLLRIEENRFKKLFELLEKLHSEVKKAIPPSLQGDTSFWETFWGEIATLLPFCSLAWAGATPHVQAANLVADSLGANASLVEQLGVVPWEALSDCSKAIAGSFQAINVGFLIYNCVELAQLVNSAQPDVAKKLDDVTNFLELYCPNHAKVDQTVDSLRDVVRDSAKRR